MKIKQDKEVKGRERKLRKKKEILRRGEYKREKIKIRERDNREREREREREKTQLRQVNCGGISTVVIK